MHVAKLFSITVREACALVVEKTMFLPSAWRASSWLHPGPPGSFQLYDFGRESGVLEGRREYTH